MSKPDDLFALPIAHERIMTDADRARLELTERQICELAGIAGVVSAAGLLPHVDMDKPEEITEAVRKLRAQLKWFEDYYAVADEVMSTCIDASRHENTLQEVEKVLQFEERNPKPE
jgi:hypothetical protein